MIIDNIKEKLFSKKSSERRSAAKRIGKEKMTSLAKDLYVAYTKENLDKRTWETQSEMIRALGILDYKPALNDIEKIVRKNIPHDTITRRAATAFVQLMRKSIYDAKPVLELLSFGSISVISAALQALAVDSMLPPDNEIKKIIKISWDINKHKDRIGKEYGLEDPRKNLAAACAGWDITLTKDFLNHCIETAYNINKFNKQIKNDNMIDVCQKALEGKYVKLVWL